MERLFALLLLSAAVAGLRAQADSSSIGGGDDDAVFESGGLEEGTASWTEVDSLFHLPSHALYRSWTTDRIFQHQLRANDLRDTVSLPLAHAPCDHDFPVCGRITSGFGPRHGRMHQGVDIKLWTGDTVVSAFAGRVRISQYDRGYGNVVVVRHHNGLETLYAHLSKRSVSAGDDVEAGELLGLGGNTGRSTGSHLHFEVRYLGEALDPAHVFNIVEGDLIGDTLLLHRGIFRGLNGPGGVTSHRVRSGDTLSAIARRYGTTVGTLCRLNGIRSSATLRVDQRLRVR
ncbi:MAG TPA: peptidoglycan DD-metalloendopeptidase family protein [Flavobacteriales bacterium]|nr:peptidoglycan DD-metalloendopeptidase family protein [Flavobacteriales bacterium]MCB0814491.1 peptidoglycan DD-metalloendopeptidase family protein [Flavobacteriales bacterium]MCB0816133.1 peptidoglycan DD-metalloendopeptidase family protein [Flavobacteriales bacterium]MCB9181193.1 peptidoglycan DD-metalloendopeptidase family protein [Flavobacteriales bacterium]MCB9199428.1 peptidoglycan DD-metalloendopeptidase family protein [Flavobacteriales bacterium]